MKKKRNPADLTKRNNDARKKEIAELKKRIEMLEAFNESRDANAWALFVIRGLRSKKAR